MRTAACDAQFLRGADGSLIVKEFAVFESMPGHSIFNVATFSPPYPREHLPPKYARHNQYVEAYLHGISWESGDTPYEKLSETLCVMTAPYDSLYVKGLEKMRTIQMHLPSHITLANADDVGCPRLKSLPWYEIPCHNNIHCFQGQSYCAVLNAKRLDRWMRSVRLY